MTVEEEREAGKVAFLGKSGGISVVWPERKRGFGCTFGEIETEAESGGVG